jgi:hypothetical protein
MIDQAYVSHLRNRQKLYVKLLLCCITLVPVGFVGMALLPGNAGLWFGALPDIALVLVIVLIVPLFRFAASPCPQCKKPFHQPGGFIKNVFCSARLSDRHCIHCGFSLETDRGNVEQPAAQVQSEGAPSD